MNSESLLPAIARQYAEDPSFKSSVDRALGVFHLPPHRPGACEGCDSARAKGQIKDADWTSVRGTSVVGPVGED